MSKKYEILLFDLDGTITDSALGITNSVMYALKKFGIEETDRTKLYKFIGPPLTESFEKFYGFTKEQSLDGVKYYREYYHDKGIYENRVYDGLEEVLKKINEAGKQAIVATSKPEALSIEIMDKFDLSKYFIKICGATLDRSRITKSDVIAYLLENYKSDGEMVMVGDTAFDVTGAAAHGIPTIGVSWGYGSKEEMLQAGAVAIAHSVQELLTFLTQ